MADVVGAQLPEEQVEWSPQLAGMGPEKTAGVFNPLQKDFRVIYARDLAVAPTPSPGMAFAREKGMDLSKRGTPVEHRNQAIILKSGETVNLPADIAQKVVQDLTTYILGERTGHKRTADPFSRGEVEKEIIMYVKNTNDILNISVEPVEKPPNPPPGQGVSFEPKNPKAA